ncbi:MAG: hypothetical protein ACR2P1_03740 [Pseudomonadales bacterium]
MAIRLLLAKLFKGGTLCALTCGLVLLAACSGSSSDNATDTVDPAPQSGAVVISLTDAEGDFLSYTVDVLSVKLISQSGAEVETLPHRTMVDFSQYTELTEFLTAATVPNGLYIAAAVEIDYSDAQIVVENAAGDAVDAVAVDVDGNPLTQLMLEVDLQDTDGLRVRPGVPAHITLDFDLEASNDVDSSVTPAQVVVGPVLIADTVLQSPKEHRLRGLLNEVSVADSIFSVFIRPFYRLNGEYGSLRVTSTADTHYEINTKTFTGEAGLVELAAQDPRTPLTVLGELDIQARSFTASHVLAGSSVPWGDKPIVTGNVLSRTWDVITLSSGRVLNSNGEIRFHRKVTVVLGQDTKVTQQGMHGAELSTDAISVGQRVWLTGELVRDTQDDVKIDARASHVRLQYTDLDALVVEVVPLVLNVQSFDNRAAAKFDFSGTGSTVENDAIANHYDVDVSSLPLAGIEIMAPVKVRGFVSAFGTAPEDFSARTLVDVSELRAKLGISWIAEGSTSPFNPQSSHGLGVDSNADAIGRAHHVKRAGVTTDLQSLSQIITIQPNGTGRGLFALATDRKRVRVFHNFSRFEAALAEVLNGSNKVKAVFAQGNFSDSSAEFTAARLVVKVNVVSEEL